MDTCSCPNCQFPADWPQFNDPQWERLAPLLPQGTGLRSDTTRRQVDGMLYALETGGAWRLLPTQFGPPDLVETRFRRWSAAGVLRRAYATLYPPRTLARGRTVIIDGSYAKVHISAAGARVGRSGQRCQFWCPGWCPGKRPWYCRETQAIGKTRGGFNTNIVTRGQRRRPAGRLALAARQRAGVAGNSGPGGIHPAARFRRRGARLKPDPVDAGRPGALRAPSAIIRGASSVTPGIRP